MREFEEGRSFYELWTPEPIEAIKQSISIEDFEKTVREKKYDLFDMEEVVGEDKVKPCKVYWVSESEDSMDYGAGVVIVTEDDKRTVWVVKPYLENFRELFPVT